MSDNKSLQTLNTMQPSLFLNEAGVRQSIINTLGDAASYDRFKMELISNINAVPKLQECTNSSLLVAHLQVASLKLPLSNSLGMAYVIPYKNRSGGYEANFQLGYKGLIQLALRGGHIRKLTAIELKEGEIAKYDRLLEEYTFNQLSDEERDKRATVAYIARLELSCGFVKTVYMTKQEVQDHAQRFSKSYHKSGGPWQEHFDAMAKKTLLLKVLNPYAPLTTELQSALASDHRGDYIEGGYREVENEAQEKPQAAPKKKAPAKKIEDPKAEAMQEVQKVNERHNAKYESAAPEPAPMPTDDERIPFVDY